MSRRINTTPRSEEAIKHAEAALYYFKGIAFSADPEIAHCHSELYKSADKALHAAIKFAWPHMDAKRIVTLWVDCNESLRYCVGYIRTNNRYPF